MGSTGSRYRAAGSTIFARRKYIAIFEGNRRYRASVWASSAASALRWAGNKLWRVSSDKNESMRLCELRRHEDNIILWNYIDKWDVSED